MRIGLLQGNFRSSFPETVPEIAKIANFQEEMGPEDFRYNQQLLITLAREAAAGGAQLLLGPETYLDGWSFRADVYQQSATTIPGPEIDELAELAAELKVWICVGLFEKAQGKLFNSAALLSAQGKLVGIYRKTHETKNVLQKMPYDLGHDLPVFESPWGRIAVLICHDRWYPEAARTLRHKGAQLILNPVAAGVFWPGHKYYDIHRAVLRSQAYLNGLFWAGCNHANHGGHSLLIGPDGRIIAEAGDRQRVLLAELDLQAHSSYDFLSNLHPGLYDFP